uniref:Uncharacterized protein n=1 Tax=Monodelphis domestica TaxID=13616 RepID=A0A5F8HBJ4_MONDO
MGLFCLMVTFLSLFVM